MFGLRFNNKQFANKQFQTMFPDDSFGILYWATEMTDYWATEMTDYWDISMDSES